MTSARPLTDPNLGFLLHDAARLLRKRFEQNARGLGLTRAQWQVLAHLARREGIHQAALADLLEMDGITLVRILDKLEARELVERRQHPTDRRVWLLYLRPAAGPVIRTMHALGRLTRAEATDGLGPAAQAALVEALCRIKANLADACTRPPATIAAGPAEETMEHG